VFVLRGRLSTQEIRMALESSTTTTVTRYSMATSLGLLFARIPLGSYFIFASAAKLRMGVDTFVNLQLQSAMKFLPEHLARTYLTYLPWVELSVGILLILGLLTRFVAAIMVLLLISFTLHTGVSGTLAPEVKLPFHPNLVYLGVALAVMLCGPGWLSLDGLIFRPRRRVVVE
jgi:uncharacterized membrane protein YphA (DoxX/SURF4 family)